jgi:hypothetical protein
MAEGYYRTRMTYIKRMSVDELAKFMSENQEWNLARLWNAPIGNLTKITQDGMWSSKPIAVEGTDGIMYSGVAAAYHNWGGHNNPALVLKLVLGKNQTDSKSLDDRMKEIGFSHGGPEYI